MVNLGSVQKAKIREEENYRFEVRKELESQLPITWGEILAKLLAKPIAVIIEATLLAWLSSYVVLLDTVDRKIQEKEFITAKKLKAEIDYRAIRINGYLENLEQDIRNDEQSEIKKVGSQLLVQATGQAGTNLQINLFSEYAGQSMNSLLSKLAFISGSSSTLQKILSNAIVATEELQSLQEILDSTDAPTTAFLSTQKILHNTIASTKELQTIQEILVGSIAPTTESRSISADTRSSSPKTTAAELIKRTEKQLRSLAIVTKCSGSPAFGTPAFDTPAKRDYECLPSQ